MPCAALGLCRAGEGRIKPWMPFPCVLGQPSCSCLPGRASAPAWPCWRQRGRGSQGVPASGDSSLSLPPWPQLFHDVPGHSLPWKWELCGSVELEFPAGGGGCCPAVPPKSHRALAPSWPLQGSTLENLAPRNHHLPSTSFRIWNQSFTYWVFFFSCFAWILTVKAELT